MGDMHIREYVGGVAHCVFHVQVPATLNSGGILWSAAIKEYFAPEPVMPNNDPTENDKIIAGEVIEGEVEVKFSVYEKTAAQKIDRIKAKYIAMKDSYVASVQKKLEYYGKAIDI